MHQNLHVYSWNSVFMTKALTNVHKVFFMNTKIKKKIKKKSIHSLKDPFFLVSSEQWIATSIVLINDCLMSKSEQTRMETVWYFYANFATLAMNLRHHTELKHPARKYLPVIDNSKKFYWAKLHLWTDLF